MTDEALRVNGLGCFFPAVAAGWRRGGSGIDAMNLGAPAAD